jgi:hypothetical protein
MARHDQCSSDAPCLMEARTNSAIAGCFRNVGPQRWALLTAVGSFVLYLFGYLTLRFRLSTFGIATDLAVLDERYLFAGAQFLVYFLTAIPIVLLPLLLLLPFRRRLNLFCIAGSRNRIGC